MLPTQKASLPDPRPPRTPLALQPAPQYSTRRTLDVGRYNRITHIHDHAMCHVESQSHQTDRGIQHHRENHRPTNHVKRSRLTPAFSELMLVISGAPSLAEHLPCEAQGRVPCMPPPLVTPASGPSLTRLGHARRAYHSATAHGVPELIPVSALRMRQKVLQLHVLQAATVLLALVSRGMPRLGVREEALAYVC